MRTVFGMAAFIILISGCQQASHLKTPGGMPYQLFKGKGGKEIKPGNYIKIHFTQKIQDSIYFSTHGKLPMFMRVNEQPAPYDLSEIWTKVKTGDSIISTQFIDTFIARNPANVPPHFKKGDRIITYIKVLDVFTTDSLAMADNEKVKAEWLAVETAELAKYLADKKINAAKTASGAYVEIKQEGSGNAIDSGNYVSVDYTGKTISGKVFDSNTDSAFHHMTPLSFTVGTGQMIKGFDEGVRMLKKGSEAVIYIPSILGYAGNPPSPDIKPFENLVFDVKVVDVQATPPARNQNPQNPNVDPHQK